MGAEGSAVKGGVTLHIGPVAMKFIGWGALVIVGLLTAAAIVYGKIPSRVDALEQGQRTNAADIRANASRREQEYKQISDQLDHARQERRDEGKLLVQILQKMK